MSDLRMSEIGIDEIISRVSCSFYIEGGRCPQLQVLGGIHIYIFLYKLYSHIECFDIQRLQANLAITKAKIPTHFLRYSQVSL